MIRRAPSKGPPFTSLLSLRDGECVYALVQFIGRRSPEFQGETNKLRFLRSQHRYDGIFANPLGGFGIRLLFDGYTTEKPKSDNHMRNLVADEALQLRVAI